jgi:hypothetical protein
MSENQLREIFDPAIFDQAIAHLERLPVGHTLTEEDVAAYRTTMRGLEWRLLESAKHKKESWDVAAKAAP